MWKIIMKNFSVYGIYSVKLVCVLQLIAHIVMGNKSILPILM